MSNKTNFEKYNLLHDEVMKRLEAGKVTIEQAKELNNRFFDKYIVDEDITTESVRDIFDKISIGITNFKLKGMAYEAIDLNDLNLNSDIKERINDYKKFCESSITPIKNIITESLKELNLTQTDVEIRYDTKFKVSGIKSYKYDKERRKIEIIGGITHATITFKKSDVEGVLTERIREKLTELNDSKSHKNISKKCKPPKISIWGMGDDETHMKYYVETTFSFNITKNDLDKDTK